MQTFVVKHHSYSQSERNLIKNLVAVSVENFITTDQDRKFVNTLLNDRVITENQMKSILLMLKGLIPLIEGKIDDIKKEYDPETLPETTGQYSLILRPREFVNMIMDSYRMHIRNIKELIVILVTETPVDEDDD